MILVYDMSSGERLDAVPGKMMGEAAVEPSATESERPMMREPEVAPALQEVVVESTAGEPIPLVAAIDVERLLERMG